MQIAVGSFLTLLLVLLLTLTSGYWSFNRRVNREVKALFAQQPLASPIASDQEIVTEAMLQELPAPIQRYLRYSGIVGKPRIHTVRLKQTGRFRQGPAQPWMEFRAQQYFTVDTPGFLWNVTMYQNGLPLLIGRDLYMRGTGNMLIKLAARITVADAKGEGLDQGTMLRYLAEMIWFPSAFLGENVSFTPIDDSSATITFSDHFPWSFVPTEYGERGGLRIPVQGPVSWLLPAGKFAYIDPTIVELEYDVAQPY